jgi:hypothetical protein
MNAAKIRTIPSMLGTPDCSSNTRVAMTEEQLQAAFKEWWADSFPLANPSAKTVETHVAFALHALELDEVMSEYKQFDR